MTDATANLASAGSDSAQPAISLDDAANLDFYDPATDTVEDEEEQQSEGATDEAGEGQEAEETAPAEDDDTAEAEAEGAEDESADAKPEPTDDVTVSVNGERLALSELKSGYMRQADYSRKTQDVATQRKSLEALSARVTKSVDAISQFLVSQLPQAPDQSLLMTDPVAFMQQKEMHEAAMGRINEIVSQANEAKEVGNTLTQEQRSELIQSENAKLAEAFPQSARPETRKQSFQGAMSAAAEMGFTPEEISGALDHRF
jgi:hypothetical protein